VAHNPGAARQPKRASHDPRCHHRPSCLSRRVHQPLAAAERGDNLQPSSRQSRRLCELRAHGEYGVALPSRTSARDPRGTDLDLSIRAIALFASRREHAASAAGTKSRAFSRLRLFSEKLAASGTIHSLRRGRPLDAGDQFRRICEVETLETGGLPPKNGKAAIAPGFHTDQRRTV
jgi:hypothetical protein